MWGTVLCTVGHGVASPWSLPTRRQQHPQLYKPKMSLGIARCSAEGVRSKIATAENACSTSFLRVLVDTQRSVWNAAAGSEAPQVSSAVATPRDILGFYNWGTMVSISQALGSPGPGQKPIRKSESYADSEQEQLKPARLQKQPEPAGVLSASVARTGSEKPL